MMLLLSLLLIVSSGASAGPGLNAGGLPDHADFTPVHDTAFIPAQERLLVNTRGHAEPEDASDSGDDAGLPGSVAGFDFCSGSAPVYSSIAPQYPLLSLLGCPARAPPLFS